MHAIMLILHIMISISYHDRTNLFLDDHVPEVSKGGWFRSGACNEPLWAAGNENLFVRVLGFHPATVEDNLAGVEVTNLVARKNVRG